MAEIVTPGEMARTLSISPKTLRASLRAGREAGHPLVTGHEHYGRWEFTPTEARSLVAEYRRAHSPAISTVGPPLASFATTRAQTTATKAWGAAAPATSGVELPPLPEEFSRPALTAVGFEGFKTSRRLRESAFGDVLSATSRSTRPPGSSRRPPGC